MPIRMTYLNGTEAVIEPDDLVCLRRGTWLEIPGPNGPQRWFVVSTDPVQKKVTLFHDDPTTGHPTTSTHAFHAMDHWRLKEIT